MLSSTFGPMTRIVMLNWPRRRWLAAGMLAVPLGFGYGSLTQPLSSAAWLLVVVGSMVAASLTLASYVPAPGSGRMVEIGCSPCAIVAVGAVLISFVVRTGAGHDPGLATMSLLALGFGLTQRLTDRSCPLPATPVELHGRAAAPGPGQ